MRDVPELVRQDDPNLVVRERLLEERVPDDDPLGRPEADRERIRLLREVAHLLDVDGRVDALRSLERLARPGEAR